MIDYKLVPIGPTPEWVAALKKVRIGRLESVIGDVLAAAPAVQGEPVYLYRRRGLDDFVTCNHERYAELSAKPRLFETKVLYAAPQPVEQQPEQHDTKGSRKALGAMNAKLRAKVGRLERALAAFPAQQSAPDVTQLVEALEQIAAFQPKDILCGSGWKEWNRAGEYAASIARDALAAHRKQGGES